MPSPARIEELEKKYAESPRRFFAPLANEFRKSGDPGRAIELCRAHLEQQPNHMSGQVVLGQALYDAGLKGEAREAFELALTLDPENLIALRHLGDMAREGEDYSNARSWYMKVLDVDSRNPEMIAVVREIDDILSAHAVGVNGAGGDAAATVEPPLARSVADRWAASPVAEVNAPEAPAPEAAVEPPPAAVPDVEPDSEQVEEFWTAAEEVPEEVRNELEAPASSAGEGEARPETVEPDLSVTAETSWRELSGEVAVDAASDAPEMVETLAEEVSDSVASAPLEVEKSPDLSLGEIGEKPTHRTPTWLATSYTEELNAISSVPAPASDMEPQAPSEPEPIGVVSAPETGGIAGADEEHIPAAHAGAGAPVSEDEVTPEASEESAWESAAPEVEPDMDDALAWEMEMLASQSGASRENADDEWAPALDAEAEAQEETDETADEGWRHAVASESKSHGAADMSHMEVVEPPADDYADEAPVVPAPPVFITETMAQLYEQQGYIEMAAAVYRQLLERAPGNDRYRTTVADLEQRIATKSETRPDRRAVAAEEGDSAKGFFSSLVQVPLRPRLARPYVSGRYEAVNTGGSGSGGSSIADAGSPAREAQNALSLESVFKNGSGRAGPGGAGGGFSFDHFFVTGGQQPAQGGAAEREPRGARRKRGEDAEEIEQFNSWLEGLKRS